MNKTIERLQESIAEFGREREWTKFHSPKNLSMALAVESSELLEHFQWLTEQESRQLPADKKREVAREVADIFMYMLLLCKQLNLDPIDAVEEKLRLNEKRFPKAPKED